MQLGSAHENVFLFELFPSTEVWTERSQVVVMSKASEHFWSGPTV